MQQAPLRGDKQAFSEAYSRLAETPVRFSNQSFEHMKDFDNQPFEVPLEEFRRPPNRSLLSPCPTENRDYLHGSPLPRSLLPRENPNGHTNEYLYDAGEMHLDVTPLKPQPTYVKRKTEQSDEILDFTQYQYTQQDLERYQERYQTPSRAEKQEDKMGELPTAQTIRNNPPIRLDQKCVKIAEEPYMNSPGKQSSIKGLRALAEDVSRIVETMRYSTYKEVAEMQIQKMESEGKISRNSKDSQNVKRRVYDALNVLISAGVLMREGKTVCMDPSLSKTASRSIRHDQREKLREQILHAERNLSEKQAKLECLTKRYAAQKYLVERNKASSDKLIPEESEESKKIPLPCVVVSSSHGNYKCRLLRKTLRISSKDVHGMRILGDLDVLVQLGFHQRSRSLPIDMETD